MTELYACLVILLDGIVKLESKWDQTFEHWHIPLAFDQWLVIIFLLLHQVFSFSLKLLVILSDNLSARNNASACIQQFPWNTNY